jgi:hypothetical protein
MLLRLPILPVISRARRSPRHETGLLILRKSSGDLPHHHSGRIAYVGEVIACGEAGKQCQQKPV